MIDKEALVLNLIVAVTGIAYGYITGDTLPAIMGGLMILLAWEDLSFLTVFMAAGIGYLCVYHFWVEVMPNLDPDDLGEFWITSIYLFIAGFRAFVAFR